MLVAKNTMSEHCSLVFWDKKLIFESSYLAASIFQLSLTLIFQLVGFYSVTKYNFKPNIFLLYFLAFAF